MYEKLLEIQKLHITVKKDTQAYNYKYATLDQIWEKLEPECSKRDLVVYHSTSEGKVCTYVVDKKTSEENVSCIPLPEDLAPQKLGSAITYYRRYNLLQLFNIMTDDDDDAQSTVKGKKGNGITNRNDKPF